MNNLPPSAITMIAAAIIIIAAALATLGVVTFSMASRKRKQAAAVAQRLQQLGFKKATLGDRPFTAYVLRGEKFDLWLMDKRPEITVLGQQKRQGSLVLIVDLSGQPHALPNRIIAAEQKGLNPYSDDEYISGRASAKLAGYKSMHVINQAGRWYGGSWAMFTSNDADSVDPSPAIISALKGMPKCHIQTRGDGNFFIDAMLYPDTGPEALPPEYRTLLSQEMMEGLPKLVDAALAFSGSPTSVGQEQPSASAPKENKDHATP